MGVESRSWADVDRYLVQQTCAEDEALSAARVTSRAAGLPSIEVSPNQAKLLYLLCRMIGARRVLEFGTLGGYSAIWFARAVGDGGWVTTLELEARHAEVARRSLAAAGVGGRVEVIEGPALDSSAALIAAQVEPYDFVFIDADKPNNPRYLQAAIELTRPGGVIVVDNVVRAGEVADAQSRDERVLGSRGVIELMGADPRLDATALQTVGSKGWDGLAIARVR